METDTPTMAAEVADELAARGHGEHRDPATTGQRIREMVEAEAAVNDDDDLDDDDLDDDADNAASGHEFFGTLTDEQRAEMIAVAADTIAACIQASGAEGMPCPTCGTGLVPISYQQSRTHARCEACEGLGKVMTGSLVAGKDYEFCGVCHGNGWTPQLAHAISEIRRPDPIETLHRQDEAELPPVPIDPTSLLIPGPVSQVA